MGAPLRRSNPASSNIPTRNLQSHPHSTPWAGSTRLSKGRESAHMTRGRGDSNSAEPEREESQWPWEREWRNECRASKRHQQGNWGQRATVTGWVFEDIRLKDSNFPLRPHSRYASRVSPQNCQDIEVTVHSILRLAHLIEPPGSSKRGQGK